MLFRYCAAQVNDRQQHKNVSLQECNAYVQADEDDRDTDRNHGEKDESHQVPGENVGPQTNRERQQPCNMADQFDGKHQCRQKDADNERHPLHGRSEEMLEIVPYAVMLDALPVVVTERTDSTAQGNDWNSS